MIQPITFSEQDRIAVIAPHPDDECLGAASALLMAADRTDIIVITDGSHGNASRTEEEEAVIRKRQFEAEMAYIRPRSWHWLGIEDTKLSRHLDALDGFDFTVYTKIFMPWIESLHPDHRAAAQMCRQVIRRQKASAACWSYEITSPFNQPTHYIDITGVETEKQRLFRFHEDQLGRGQEEITMSLNAFRGARLRLHRKPACGYAEAFLQVDAWDYADAPDLLLKLYEIRDDPEIMERIEKQGIRIKRVMPMNITAVYNFIRDRFALSWADECLPAMLNGDCYVAVRDHELLGFIAVDVPSKDFLGPIGVIPSERHKGIAKALDLTGMKALRAKGYQYAISGMVHPSGRRLDEEIVKLIPIPDSAGSYCNML